jgi:hypothetical protein
MFFRTVAASLFLSAIGLHACSIMHARTARTLSIPSEMPDMTENVFCHALPSCFPVSCVMYAQTTGLADNTRYGGKRAIEGQVDGLRTIRSLSHPGRNFRKEKSGSSPCASTSMRHMKAQMWERTHCIGALKNTSIGFLRLKRRSHQHTTLHYHSRMCARAHVHRTIIGTNGE